MPSFSPVELEAYVRQRAPEIARDIRIVSETSRNEADLVAATEKVLEKFAKNFDVQLHLERERTLINGRADAVYNRFVIEYEPPRSLAKSNTHRNNKHAIDQVKQYIEGLERLDRHRKERMAGVALDGAFFIFARYRDESWHIDEPLPVDAQSTETFLRYLLSLSTELALTPENLVRDFGENSNTARHVVPILYASIKATDNKKALILFRQWQRQFREVTGYDPESTQLDQAGLARLYAVRDRHLELEKLFFAIHTYYATFIKLLAVQVAHYYLMPKVGTGLATATSYSSEKLCHYLQDMEKGGLFVQLGIRNFLEGDFFGWYLDIWDETLDTALRRLVADLANYSLVTLDVDPEETRDLLKHLYQNLMPKNLRHALGEYYTPDWLAERVLNQLGYDGNPSKRLLDPSCGSGTFPVLALKRARQYAQDKMLPPGQVLEQLLSNIVGFDLNPLAVISARTNYLLALGDLLPHRRGDISIPVYLADSILTPSQGSDLFTRNAYSFTTAVGDFSIPKSLVHARYIDQLAGLLEESVSVRLEPHVFRLRLMDTFPLQSPDDDAEIEIAVSLYTQILSLDEQGIDGVWARIIKNAFAPLFQGRFDFIAGNPPWITWQNLPADYRDASSYLWDYYNLFETSVIMKRQMSARVQADISVLLFYVCFDRYLKENGKLGFLITQSIFQSVIAGRGFRRFELPNRTKIAVLHVDDFTSMQPFEGATNLTAIVLAQANNQTKYPLPYTIWQKNLAGWQPSTTAELEEVTSATKIIYADAMPISPDDVYSPWLTGKKEVLHAVKKVIGSSPYHEVVRKGSDTRGANGIFWVQIVAEEADEYIVSNLTEASRGNVENIQAALEKDYVYPLLRGRDVQRWSCAPSSQILVPYSHNGSSIVTEEVLSVKYPKTYAYLKHFERNLRNRPQFRNFDPRSGVFYMLYNVGSYVFSPYKVVWREQSSTFTAAVALPLSGKVQIPDHKLSVVPVKEELEAYYLCGLLNSSISQAIVKSYSLGTSIDTHVLNYINCPDYSAKEKIHKEIALLSQQAHAASGEHEQIGQIEEQIDELARYVWGLTNKELKEIQKSLTD